MGNVAFAVTSKWRPRSRAKIEAHARTFIELSGLTAAAAERLAELRGDMKQGVGIARAFSIELKTMLMDKPLSALDSLTHGALQDEAIHHLSHDAPKQHS